MNVAMYLRKSRADAEAEARGEGETLARHQKILTDLAEKQGLTVGAVYREIVSGETLASRPQMQRLLSEVEAGAWDAVLVVEVERLARGDTIDQGIVSQAFTLSNTKIITPIKTYDPNNEYDQEYFEFGLFMSRREYKTINRRLQRGRLESVKEGKCAGNKSPYGYERVRIQGDRGFTLKIVPEQAAIVRKIYDWYVNGVDGKMVGTPTIVRMLHDMGVPSPAGNEYWSAATIKPMLQNPVYIGMVTWGRRAQQKSVQDGVVTITRPRLKEYDTYKGLHEPIIDQETFDAAQKRRTEYRMPHAVADLPLTNPLARVLYCARCGHVMYRRPYMRNMHQPMILCQQPGCTTVAADFDAVEHRVLESLAEWLEAYKADWRIAATQAPGTDDLEAVAKAAEKELRTLKAQKGKLFDLLEQGIYDVTTFRTRSADLDSRISTAEQRAASAREAADTARVRAENAEEIIPRIEQVLAYYWQTDDPAVRNQLLRSVLVRAEYTRDHGGRWYKGDKDFSIRIFPRI
jgi:resolvase